MLSLYPPDGLAGHLPPTQGTGHISGQGEGDVCAEYPRRSDHRQPVSTHRHTGKGRQSVVGNGGRVGS